MRRDLLNCRIESICAVLRQLRLSPAEDEARLRDRIGAALTSLGIGFGREVPLGKGSRIDLLTDGGVGIEVKRGRPARRDVILQLARYAASDRVAVLILVAEGSAALPAMINGKPCVRICLNGNWGVAL